MNDLTSLAECRAITEVFVGPFILWQYQFYSFLGQGKRDFDIQHYGMSESHEPFHIASKQGKIFKLGHQYEFVLSENPPGTPVMCYGLRRDVANTRYEAELGLGGPPDGNWWACSMTIWSNDPLDLIRQSEQNDKTYYLRVTGVPYVGLARWYVSEEA